jgi:DNA-binding MarR family transcriptional regulator
MVDVSTSFRENRGVEDERTERAGAWLNLLQVNTVVAEAIEQRLKERHGLSLAEHEVLVRLSHAPGGLRMQDLASLVLVSKSGVTRLIDRLVAGGLVRRVASPTDRRVIHASITRKGQVKVERSMPDFLEALEEAFSRHLDEADVDILRAALRKILLGNGAWEDRRCASAYTQAPEPASALA